jgi:formylglycine-generating enzyme required for sulfatase activity
MKTIFSKTIRCLFVFGAVLCIATPCGLAQTNLALGVQLYAGLSITGAVGANCQIQYITNLTQTNAWLTLTGLTLTGNPQLWVDTTCPATAQRFYRATMLVTNQAPANMVLIPVGSFVMGDGLDGMSDALPLHGVSVSAFYMDKYLVTKALWDDVFNWAMVNGYSFDNFGQGKATNHPVHTVSWYDCVKWCNARSEKEGRTPAYCTDAAQTMVYRGGKVDVKIPWVKWNRGYRLPTEAEWEKAARGGANGHRFPWSNVNTISHDQANYYSYYGNTSYPYDLGPTSGFHPTFDDGVTPYTSPVGYFAPNGYGLYDMAGNVCEWCWDWYASYSSASQTDPRGPADGSDRVRRGGDWYFDAYGGPWSCRTAYRGYDSGSTGPVNAYSSLGFRCVLPLN